MGNLQPVGPSSVPIFARGLSEADWGTGVLRRKVAATRPEKEPWSRQLWIPQKYWGRVFRELDALDQTLDSLK